MSRTGWKDGDTWYDANLTTPLPVQMAGPTLTATNDLTGAVVDNAGLAGDTVVKAAVAGQTTRVHALRLSVAGATIITVKRGATVLEKFNFAGNGGGVILDFRSRPHYITAANETFVINSSAAVQVDGRAEYVTSA